MSPTLRHGRSQVAIPGPSIVPDRVLAAMHRPMPNIYDGPLIDVSNSLFADLPSIARTDGEVFVVIGNGHAAWQMAVSNTVRRGDRILVLESGTFAVIWGQQAAMSGADVEVLPGTDDGPVDPAAVEERLAPTTTTRSAACWWCSPTPPPECATTSQPSVGRSMLPAILHC